MKKNNQNPNPRRTYWESKNRSREKEKERSREILFGMVRSDCVWKRKWKDWFET